MNTLSKEGQDVDNDLYCKVLGEGRAIFMANRTRILKILFPGN